MSTRTRDKMVRDLSPDEAGALLVHCHSISPERRQALLFRRGPVAAYFTAEQAAEIKAWIEAEQYLPADSPFDHPKQATHWCDRHGHVITCECDRKRGKRGEEPKSGFVPPRLTIEQWQNETGLVAAVTAWDKIAGDKRCLAVFYGGEAREHALVFVQAMVAKGWGGYE